MKNENISSNKLDDYFALARDMQPVIGVEEMERQIRNAGMGSNKSFLHNLKFKIVMTSSIIIASVYITSLFLNTGGKMITQPKTVESLLSNTIVLSNTATDTKNETKNSSHALTNGGQTKQFLSPTANMPMVNRPLPENDISLNDFDFKHLSSSVPVAAVPQVQDKGNDSIKPKLNPEEFLRVSKPLELDNAHLSKMGFTQGVNYLEYQANIEGRGSIHFADRDNGTDINMDDKPMDGYSSFDFYPVFISDKNGKCLDCGGDKEEAMNIDLSLRKENKKAETPSIYDQNFSLIPVLFKASKYKGFAMHKDVIFWFKQTPSLLSVLADINIPKMVAINVNDAKVTQKQIMVNVGGKQFELHPNVNSNKIDSYELEQIKFLELDREHLKKLGFKFGPDGISYKCTITGHGTLEYSNDIKHTGLKVNAPRIFTKRGQDFYPVFISNKSGIQFFKYRIDGFEDKDKWSDAYFLAAIRKLVPVVVKQNIPGLADQQDMVFWFNVTPSFLEMLPDTISHDMGNEYKVLTKSNSKDADTNSVTTCKYFDVCQLPLEKELKVNIYPNPAQLILNVDFEPTANTTATLYMTDLSGKIVKTMNPTYSGTQHLQIQTGDLKSGIYLVILKMSNSTILTNKVVITGKD